MVSHIAFARFNAVHAWKIERLKTLFGEMELPVRAQTPARRLPCVIAAASALTPHYRSCHTHNTELGSGRMYSADALAAPLPMSPGLPTIIATYCVPSTM